VWDEKSIHAESSLFKLFYIQVQVQVQAYNVREQYGRP
jgi:hypothetical protein